jgi:hypothetical protein
MSTLIAGSILLGLLLSGCGLPFYPTPPALPEPREIVVATPTPIGASLLVEEMELLAELSLATPAGIPPLEDTLLSEQLALRSRPTGSDYLVVQAQIANTGSAPMTLSLADVYLRDAAGRVYPRVIEAEFYLTLLGYPAFPDDALPPGTATTGTLAFDLPAGLEGAVQVVVDVPGQTALLISAPITIARGGGLHE